MSTTSPDPEPNIEPPPRLHAAVVDMGGGSTAEEWIVIQPDGSMILHHENDGPRFLRRGPEATDRPITLAEARERFAGTFLCRGADSRSYRPLDRVEAALADFAAGRQPPREG
jgi:hypothetical protein